MLLAKHSVWSGLKNSKVVILIWERRSWKTTAKVRRLGSVGCFLLWTAKTWWNCQHQSLPTANDRFKSRITRKTTGLSKKATQSFFFTIMPHHTQRNRSRKRSRHSVGKYCRMPLILQTWLRRITICSHHWATLSLNNASFCTKMYENGWITGLI